MRMSDGTQRLERIRADIYKKDRSSENEVRVAEQSSDSAPTRILVAKESDFGLDSLSFKLNSDQILSSNKRMQKLHQLPLNKSK